MISMKVVVAEEFLGLFVSDSTIHQHQSVTTFDQQGSHGPRAEVECVGWIGLGPKLSRNNPKHGASIKLEVAGVNRVQTHGAQGSHGFLQFSTFGL
jgi:hypothetical protein